MPHSASPTRTPVPHNHHQIGTRPALRLVGHNPRRRRGTTARRAAPREGAAASRPPLPVVASSTGAPDSRCHPPIRFSFRLAYPGCVAVLAQKSGYWFAEMFRVQTEGVTAVPFMSLLPGTVVKLILARCETPGTGAANLTVGDDDDADGYLIAADHTAAAGTIYGDAPTERGAYLYDATAKGGFVKLYNAAKTLKAVLSAAGTTQGTWQLLVLGHRYDEG